MASILEQFGPEGYGIYWLLLEHFASVMESKPTSVPNLTKSELSWSRICHCSVRRVRKFCQKAAELKLIESNTQAELVQFSSRTPAIRLQICIPKLLKYRDEYSRKAGHSPDCRVDTDTDTETEEIPPTPLDAETEEFAAWAEAVYKRHPKPSNRHLAFLELTKNFAHDKPARQVFDRNHKLWIASRNWQEKGGAFVPPLCKPDGSGFIPDMAWQRPPPVEVKKSNGLEYAYRELEKANQEETNNDSKKGSSTSAITVRGSPGLPEAGGTRDRRKPAAEFGLRRVGESFSQRFGQ